MPRLSPRPGILPGPLRLRRRYGRGSREIAPRRAWIPNVTPICANSPAACTAVSIISTPGRVGEGAGRAAGRFADPARGPGSRVRVVAAEGWTARGLGAAAGLARVASGVVAFDRWGAVLAGVVVTTACFAVGRARRALARCGRLDGSCESTLAPESRLRGAGIVL